MEKQISHIKLEDVNAKVEAGFALSLMELAVKTGYSYSKVREWPWCGMSLLDGKITFADFEAWKKQRTGLVSVPHTPAHRRKSSAGKSC